MADDNFALPLVSFPPPLLADRNLAGRDMLVPPVWQSQDDLSHPLSNSVEAFINEPVPREQWASPAAPGYLRGSGRLS